MPQVLLLFNLPVISSSLWPYGLQHSRPSCPSLSPEVCPRSCPLHQWSHLTMSSSDTLSSSCPQSFTASGTFPVSQLFASGDPNTGAVASASVIPMSIQGWFTLRLTDLSSLLSVGLSGVFSNATVQKHQFSGAPPSLYSSSHNVHNHWEDHTLTIWTFVDRVMSLLFNTPPRSVIAFLLRSKHLVISWLWSPPTVILESKKRKFVTTSTFYPLYLPWSNRARSSL